MSDYYSISKMATIAGCDRRTMSARVSHLTPEKETTNYKGFSLKQIFRLLLEDSRTKDVDGLSPSDQLAYWNAQLKQLEYKNVLVRFARLRMHLDKCQSSLRGCCSHKKH